MTVSEGVPPGAWGGVARAGSLRHNRDYRRLWLGQAVSLLGDEVFDTTLVLWIGATVARSESWAPLAVAGVLLAATLPVVLFSLVGGVYADRWDRRRTMLMADAVRCVLVGGLAMLALTGSAVPRGVSLTIVYLVVILATTAAQFFNPARFGLIATVVADVDRERMSSIAAGTAALATILGPSLAAVILATAGPWVSLLLNAASFAVSFVLVARVRARPEPAIAPTHTAEARTATVRQDMMVGIRFVADTRRLRVLLITTVVVMAAVSAIGTLDIFFVTHNLHAPPNLYGVLATALGLGALLGAGLTAVLARRLRPTRVYSVALIAVGILLVCYARTTSPITAVTVMFLAGVPTAAMNSMIGPLILRCTPTRLLGRVSAVLQPATRLAAMLSVATTGWLASTLLRDLDASVLGVHFGTFDTVLLAAGLVVVASGIWAARNLSERDGVAAGSESES